jgi:predicted enzyme related to lactoylglutathione lyase
MTMGKVTGIGGVFFKAQDPKALQQWYHDHLGIPLTHGFTSFEGPEAQGATTFAFFPKDTKYFGDGGQQAMFNLRVDSLDEILAQLAAAGARIDPKQESADFGRFAWFWDPEGNRVELWQPAEHGEDLE